MRGQCVTSAVPPGLRTFYIVHLPSSELLGYYQSSLRDGKHLPTCVKQRRRAGAGRFVVPWLRSGYNWLLTKFLHSLDKKTPDASPLSPGLRALLDPLDNSSIGPRSGPSCRSEQASRVSLGSFWRPLDCARHLELSGGGVCMAQASSLAACLGLGPLWHRRRTAPMLRPLPARGMARLDSEYAWRCHRDAG